MNARLQDIYDLGEELGINMPIQTNWYCARLHVKDSIYLSLSVPMDMWNGSVEGWTETLLFDDDEPIYDEPNTERIAYDIVGCNFGDIHRYDSIANLKNFIRAVYKHYRSR